MSVRRSALAGSIALALAAPARVSAHDPFEITTDAHIDVYGLKVHTTLSLDSAARICLPATPRARRFAVVEFSQFRPQFERCAGNFYALTAGGVPLVSRSVSLQLSPEDDLEIRVAYDRPTESPLSFELVGLKSLPSGAGAVLTVTGQRTFIGQKLLSPGEPGVAFEITQEGESPSVRSPSAQQAAPRPVERTPPVFERPEPRSGVGLSLALLSFALLVLGGLGALLWRHRQRVG